MPVPRQVQLGTCRKPVRERELDMSGLTGAGIGPVGRAVELDAGSGDAAAAHMYLK